MASGLDSLYYDRPDLQPFPAQPDEPIIDPLVLAGAPQLAPPTRGAALWRDIAANLAQVQPPAFGPRTAPGDIFGSHLATALARSLGQGEMRRAENEADINARLQRRQDYVNAANLAATARAQAAKLTGLRQASTAEAEAKRFETTQTEVHRHNLAMEGKTSANVPSTVADQRVRAHELLVAQQDLLDRRFKTRLSQIDKKIASTQKQIDSINPAPFGLSEGMLKPLRQKVADLQATRDSVQAQYDSLSKSLIDQFSGGPSGVARQPAGAAPQGRPTTSPPVPGAAPAVNFYTGKPAGPAKSATPPAPVKLYEVPKGAGSSPGTVSARKNPQSQTPGVRPAGDMVHVASPDGKETQWIRRKYLREAIKKGARVIE